MSLRMKSKSTEVDPFSRLTHTVNVWIWLSTIFGIIITLLALAALSVAWYGLHVQVQQSEDTITALCLEINERNRELTTIFLDLGVHSHDLTMLEPNDCVYEGLRGEP